MTLSERIKEIRKAENLTQEKFGEKLGITKDQINNIERDRNKKGTPEHILKLICYTFNISEAWLRDGSGSMYAESQTISLKNLAEAHGTTELETEIVKAYFELPEDVRKILIDHFKAHFASSPDSESAAAAVESDPSRAPHSADIDAEVEAYRRALLLQKDQAEKSSASNGQNPVSPEKK